MSSFSLVGKENWKLSEVLENQFLIIRSHLFYQFLGNTTKTYQMTHALFTIIRSEIGKNIFKIINFLWW